MEVKRKQRCFEGQKRQYLPYVIKWDCPDCGKVNTLDLTERCLSYPTFGAEHEIDVFCLDCD